jgi:hypothetical protein
MQGIFLHQQVHRGLPGGKPGKLLLLWILAVSLEAGACGWAGDGELKYDTLLPGIASGGRQIPQALDRESTRLPEGFGFGMVVVEPGHAVPYLQSTYGRLIASIEDLHAFGVRTIVDLGPHGEISAAKPADGNPRSLGYFNIPIESSAPGVAQIEYFRDLLLDPGNRPLLVTAPSAEILAITWAAYRLQLGAPLAYAIYEGKSIGLRSELESALLGWQQN